MKKLCLLLALCLLLTGCTATQAPETTAQSAPPVTEGTSTTDTTTLPEETDFPVPPETQPQTQKPAEGQSDACQEQHHDQDDNGKCDVCGVTTVVIVDFYNINDLHGKIADGENHPGVDELTTYLKKMKKSNDHTVLLSSGDMWQGTSESNLTKGLLTTDWMNHAGFSAMALGNHEYDWGEAPISG